MTRVATCAYRGSHDPATNLAHHVAVVDAAADRGARLVVFPECSLHGYPDARARATKEGVQRTLELAESVANGPHSSALIAHAAARQVYVVFGLNERSDAGEAVYNTAVLAGPRGLIGWYRKVHVGPLERATWTEGTEWPVFATELGRIGLLICADKVWPESARELTLGGAEVLVLPTAWPTTVGGDASMARRWVDYSLLFDRARAAENARWFISSNYVGPLGDTTFVGYSQIVDPYGSVLATSRRRRGLVFADIDVRDGIAATEAAWLGTRLSLDRRSSTYRRQRGDALDH